MPDYKSWLSAGVTIPGARPPPKRITFFAVDWEREPGIEDCAFYSRVDGRGEKCSVLVNDCGRGFERRWAASFRFSDSQIYASCPIWCGYDAALRLLERKAGAMLVALLPSKIYLVDRSTVIMDAFKPIPPKFDESVLSAEKYWNFSCFR